MADRKLTPRGMQLQKSEIIKMIREDRYAEAMRMMEGIDTKKLRQAQCAAILKHLKKRTYISTFQALKLYGVWRLSARIYDLRKKFIIESKWFISRKTSKRYVKYRLVSERTRATKTKSKRTVHLKPNQHG